MSWLSPTALLSIVLGYLVFLFRSPRSAEAFAPRLARGRVRTLTYVLAASVYCTAWTFYGSVGLAANRGLEFLTIYLGPGLRRAPLAGAAAQARAGRPRSSASRRSPTSSRAATASRRRSARWWPSSVVCGMIPYIALQLKAVSASFKMILRRGVGARRLRPDPAGGGRRSPSSASSSARATSTSPSSRPGLMTAVAVESVVKLLAFLAGRRLRDVGPLRRASAISSAGSPPHPELVAPAHPRPAADRLLRALGGDARDLDDGGHVPAAAVPRARGPEPARARRQRGRRGRSRSTCSSSTCSCCRSPSPGSSCSRRRAPQADGFILRLPLSLRQPAHLGARVPRRLLGGDRHDRGGLARAVQDDHQRHHPAHAAAAAAHRGHLLDHASSTRGSPCSAVRGARIRVGAHGGAASSCWWRWGSCPSSRWRSARPPSCSGSTGARGNRQGAFDGDLGRVLPLVLHADPPGAGQGGGARPSLLADGPFGHRLASADGVPRPRRGSTPSATGSSGPSS